MRFRTALAGSGLCLALVTAGCATSIAGQAEVASGARLGTSTATADSGGARPNSSVPSFPVSSGVSSTDDESTSSGADPGEPSTSLGTSGPTTSFTSDTSSSSDSTVSEGSSTSSNSSLTPLTSIPGLSADCNKVLASISAFGTVLQEASAGSDQKVSQATVDAALAQMPASGLPAQPQRDIDLLRATVQNAAGKTIVELGQTFSDGKVLAAIKDLSEWETSNCS